MPLRLSFAPHWKAALLLTFALTLPGCANMAGTGLFPDFLAGSDADQTAIAKQPVDPLNVDPLNVDPLNAQPGAPDAMSASAGGAGSQLVPLGTLTPADMNATPAKRNGPAPLIPNTTSAKAAMPTAPVAAAPAPMAPTPAPVSTAPAAVVPVLTPPPSMAAQTPPTAAQAPVAAAPQLQMPPAQPATPRVPVVTTSAKAGMQVAQPPVSIAPDPNAPIASPAPMLPSAASREFMPLPDAREFVPAQIAAQQPMTAGSAGAPKLTVADSNVIRRFQILSRLMDEGLITQDEHDRRRAANVGALLQYSKEPPGLGLERAVPAPGAISARLQALGRSLEMRAITSRQHELERSTILNSLLPEKPDPRAPKTPPPSDMFALADAAGRLAYIRDENLISESEFETEKAAMDRVMRGGEPIAKSGVGAAKAAGGKATAAAAAAAAAMPEAPTGPETLTGPVLHLASFRSSEGARSAFEQAKAKNPQSFENLRFEARKTNVGAQGTFYRLLVGPFGSLAEAEAACVEMKKVDQFCRPTPDGS